VEDAPLPRAHFLGRLTKFCFEEWQHIWNSAANNKLHAIYPVVGTSCHNNFILRREAVIINRLKLGLASVKKEHM